MSRRQNNSPTTSRRAFTIDDFCDFYSTGRSTAYAMIRAGKLRSVRIGGRRIIPADAAEDPAWLYHGPFADEAAAHAFARQKNSADWRALLKQARMDRKAIEAQESQKAAIAA